MIIDTSAIMAILLGEVQARGMELAMQADTTRWMSAATFVELSIVASVRGRDGVHDIDRFLIESGIDIIPVTAEHARIARDGFLRYGKGRHAAALNYGDCFSYALAKATGQPLLCKGDDFARTDIDLVPVAEPQR